MGNTPLTDTFVASIRDEFPDFRLKNKGDSDLMKALAWMLALLGMKEFMTSYTTTIGRTIYVPDAWSTWGDIRRVSILRHERVHLRQARKYTRIVFSFLYVFVFFPIGLAYFRAKFEKEAYEESIRATAEYRGLAAVQDPAYRTFIVEQFTTGAYLFMWPFRRSLERWFDNVVQDLARQQQN